MRVMSDVLKKKSIFDVLSSIVKWSALFFGLTVVLFTLGGCFLWISLIGKSSMAVRGHVSEDSILVLRLEGVIIDESEFLEDLHEYIKDDKIKGVLIRVDSPGGTTSASQEIYKEIHRLKAKHKKPIVVSIGSVGASGAFYVSMAGDKIVANEASLMGSIGVIIYLANLEKLYEWAKIENYVLKTGEFKDSGSSFRRLTNRERDLFQDLIDQFLSHFKEVIVKDRKLSIELVEEFADGRVFSGETALLQGFIDQTGTYYEALDLVGSLSGLGAEPEVFEPFKKPEDLLGFFQEGFDSVFSSLLWKGMMKDLKTPLLLQTKIQNKPLYLLPQAIGF